MKTYTKDEILTMGMTGIMAEIGHDSKNCTDCNRCTDCKRCINCIDCIDCADCWMSQNLKEKKYVVCNVQLTEEEYKAWRAK